MPVCRGLCLLFLLLAARGAAAEKAPFRVLYSNDTTNILTCVSPYHQRGEAWRPEMLRATVDEVAGSGVEVHLIQLSSGQVPWYQSRVYPMADHIAWWKSHFGVDPLAGAKKGIEQYILAGGDPLRLFVDECHKTGQKAFVSLRLNDVHHVELVDKPGNKSGVQSISRFYADHLDWRIGTNMKDWNQRTLDWAHPEVPDYMFSLVREQCASYDLDGFELDFMRHPSFFRTAETTSAQRVAIVSGFVKRVREVLDRTARGGRRRWLCVRVPCYLEGHDRLGVDLAAMVRAGVDMVNLSASYFTIQQCDMAAIRKMIPAAAVYLEMCHTTRVGPAASTKSAYDNFTFRRTTPQQYYTTAQLAYARGLDGVSSFNFVYYREHGVGERGPFNEPPFGIFKHLGDRAWLARQSQHYFLNASNWLKRGVLPKRIRAGESASFELDMAPPAGGWREGGRLRIQGKADLGQSRWKAVLNGTELRETADRSEPYENPYPPLLGSPAEHRAWLVPPAAIKDGTNKVTVSLLSGQKEATLVFLDFALQ